MNHEPRNFISESVSPPAGTGRRLWLWMFIVLVLVACILIGILPLGPVKAFSNRQAAKLIKDAENWEAESLYRTAAEQYEKVSGNPRIRADLRVKAAQRLGELQRDYLDNKPAAEAAFEKAYHFATGNNRDELRKELEALRGAPLDAAQRTSSTRGISATVSAQIPSSPPMQTATAPSTTTLQRGDIAVVGREHVTVEDILFAWTRLNGGKVPTREDLQSFVPQYLDMVLMADEAQQRGLQDGGRAARDLKLNRLMTLNTALAQQQVEDLKPPPDETLKAFYTDHPQLFIPPAILKIDMVLLNDSARVEEAADAFQAGMTLEKLAEKFGKGVDHAEVNAADPSIGSLNDNSGLPARLEKLKIGETTGPLTTRQAPVFFRLAEKRGGVVPRFEMVHEQVLMAYQKQALAKEHQRLLNDLRHSRNIKISKTGWERLTSTERAPQSNAEANTATSTSTGVTE